MAKINVRLLPEHTGLNDEKISPIACALQDMGISDVKVEYRTWSGYKWGFIPVGGYIPWDARVIEKECTHTKRKEIVVVTLTMEWLYPLWK